MTTCILRALVALASVSALGSSALAQAPDPYRDEPYVFEKLDTTVRVQPDGTGERITHVVLRVQSEGTARQFAVLTVSYASANETGSVDFVRVHKADGSTVETPASDAIEMPSEITREAPVYSDIREKHVPVRSLAVGDRLEYQFHVTRTRAEAPNESWGAEHFATNAGVILAQTLTLQAPSSMYLQVWSPKHPVQPAVSNGVKTWTWTYAQPKPSARDENGRMTAADVKDPDEDSDGRKLPSVAWTTFHTWAEIGDWYRGLALPRAEPTDAIRAKAADLTKDAKTPEEQVRALYRYVATQIRYVGISLGVGRYQPHAATEVLSNQYGDCKDKDTLLESLLKAKGFTTAPALIGAGVLAVPEVPTPAVFNHAITTVTLPGTQERIWLDSTAEVSPYRVLLPVLRDVNALVVPATGAAELVKTPADPPFPYREVFTAEGTLDDKGLLKAHMHLSVRSDSELGYRLMMRQVSPSQWDQAMQYVSNVMNFGGKVSNTDLRQSDPDGPVQLSWDYTREDFSDWKNGNTIPLFPALEITTIDKEKAPEHDIDQGAPRTLEAHSILTLPDGDHASLPDAVHVKRAYATYDQTYRVTDGKVYTDRIVTVLQRKVPRDQWKDYIAFTHAVGMDSGETYIRLIAPVKKDTAAKTPGTAAKDTASKDNAEEKDATARQLVDQATSAEHRGDYTEAKRLLLLAKEKDPKAPYLMSMLGYVAAHDRHMDEAIADTQLELQNHPDAGPDIVSLLAGYYAYQKDYGKAETLLRSNLDRYPDLRANLGYLEHQQGKHAEAAADYELAWKAKPDKRGMEYALADELRILHRDDEAAAHAKHAMEGSDDPNILNNNVYLLSQVKRDLPFAEQQSRRAITLLEKSTADIPLDAATSRTFVDSSNLTASWDTLAYILLLQGKPKEAEPWFRAAWMNRPEVVVGNHLGQVYEALGNKPHALALYRLALTAPGASASQEDFAAATASAKRLEKQGIKPSHDEPANVQDLRTHRLKRPANLSGSATLRLTIANNAVNEVSIVSGGPALQPLLPQVKALPLPGYTPPGSQGHVLRDAILYCGTTSPTCDLVFMTNTGTGAEAGSQ